MRKRHLSETSVNLFCTIYNSVIVLSLILTRRQKNRDCCEIGYLINTENLNNNNYNTNWTGIRLLGEELQQYGEELIVGPESFGAFLSDYNVCSVPSPDNPHPGEPEEPDGLRLIMWFLVR